MSYLLHRRKSFRGHVDLTDLVAFWKLTEASGTRSDSHTNGLDATDNNTVTQSTGETVPPYSTAADFERDNTEYLSVAHDAEIAAAENELTVTAWVNLEAIGTLDYGIVSTYKALATAGGFSLQYDNNTSNDKFRFFVVDNTGAAVIQDASTFGAASAATWYFVAARYSEANSLIEISVDGGAWDTSAITADDHQYSSDNLGLGIGNINIAAPSTNTMDGQIQAVSLWKRRLTDAEVVILSNRSSAFYHNQF